MKNTKELCREFAKEYGLSFKTSEEIIYSVFTFLWKKIFDDKEDILIRRFGSFKHKTLAKKNVRHPVTREIIVMPERDVVKFTPSEVGSSAKEEYSDGEV